MKRGILLITAAPLVLTACTLPWQEQQFPPGQPIPATLSRASNTTDGYSYNVRVGQINGAPQIVVELRASQPPDLTAIEIAQLAANMPRGEPNSINLADPILDQRLGASPLTIRAPIPDQLPFAVSAPVTDVAPDQAIVYRVSMFDDDLQVSSLGGTFRIENNRLIQ